MNFKNTISKLTLGLQSNSDTLGLEILLRKLTLGLLEDSLGLPGQLVLLSSAVTAPFCLEINFLFRFCLEPLIFIQVFKWFCLELFLFKLRFSNDFAWKFIFIQIFNWFCLELLLLIQIFNWFGLEFYFNHIVKWFCLESSIFTQIFKRWIEDCFTCKIRFTCCIDRIRSSERKTWN